jgi:threonine/homoserine/homoserine lactone efflux protein
VDARFGAWLAVSAVLIVTPGPDTALVIRNALGSGARAASLTALGVGIGSLAWAVAAALGVAFLLERSATAFTVLKLAGAGYLIYLGLRSLLGNSRPIGTSSSGPAPLLADYSALGQGLLNNLLNPKAGAFFVTVLPQFVTPADVPSRLVLMMLAYEVMVVGWLVAYGAAVSRARRRLVGSRVQRWMERATGAVLLALGVRLALERR